MKSSSDYSCVNDLFEHFCEVGLHYQLISDPGSDLISEILILLNKWLGIDILVSVFDCRESNGEIDPSKPICSCP